MGEGESMMAPKQSNEAFVLVRAALLVLPKHHIKRRVKSYFKNNSGSDIANHAQRCGTITLSGRQENSKRKALLFITHQILNSGIYQNFAGSQHQKLRPRNTPRYSLLTLLSANILIMAGLKLENLLPCLLPNLNFMPLNAVRARREQRYLRVQIAVTSLFDHNLKTRF